MLRAARVPSRLKSAWRRRDKDSGACARVLGEWLASAFPDLEGRELAENDLGATFRVLQKNEIARFGEYRTERLVLAAFDRLTCNG